jgi:hypothetical protein
MHGPYNIKFGTAVYKLRQENAEYCSTNVGGDMWTVTTVFQRITLLRKMYTGFTVHTIGVHKERLFYFKEI